MRNGKKWQMSQWLLSKRRYREAGDAVERLGMEGWWKMKWKGLLRKVIQREINFKRKKWRTKWARMRRNNKQINREMKKPIKIRKSTKKT